MYTEVSMASYTLGVQCKHGVKVVLDRVCSPGLVRESEERYERCLLGLLWSVDFGGV